MTGEIWVLFWGLPHWYQAIHAFFLDTFLNRRGHPWSAVFHCILQPLTLHMCHGSITALQPLTFLLVFSAMAKQKQNKKKHQQKQETKKTKKTKDKKTTTTWQDPTLCHYSPLGMCNRFFCFLFSGSLLVFLQWLNKTKIKKKDKTQLSATTPPIGVCNLVFLFEIIIFGFLVFWFLVFWFVVGFLKG